MADAHDEHMALVRCADGDVIECVEFQRILQQLGSQVVPTHVTSTRRLMMLRFLCKITFLFTKGNLWETKGTYGHYMLLLGSFYLRCPAHFRMQNTPEAYVARAADPDSPPRRRYQENWWPRTVFPVCFEVSFGTPQQLDLVSQGGSEGRAAVVRSFQFAVHGASTGHSTSRLRSRNQKYGKFVVFVGRCFTALIHCLLWFNPRRALCILVNTKDALRHEIEDVKPLALGIHEQEGLPPTECWAKAAWCLSHISSRDLRPMFTLRS